MTISKRFAEALTDEALRQISETAAMASNIYPDGVRAVIMAALTPLLATVEREQAQQRKVVDVLSDEVATQIDRAEKAEARVQALEAERTEGLRCCCGGTISGTAAVTSHSNPEPKEEPRLRPGEKLRCPECGPQIAIDEDGCCVTCGRDAGFYRSRLPPAIPQASKEPE